MNILFPDKSDKEIGREPCTVQELLFRFGINPLEVVVSVNGAIIPEEAIVSGDDRIRILRIAHGG